MAVVSTGTTSISFGSSLMIGYRQLGSTGPYTYLPVYPKYDQLPNYQYTVPLTGNVEIEYTEICPNCSGGIYGDPFVVSLSLT